MQELNYTIVDYPDDDYDFVYDVKKISYSDYVTTFWGQWNEQTQKELFAKFIDTYKDGIKIIKLDDTPIGFYNGEQIDVSTYEIGNVCLLPNYQGKGLGTRILKDIIDSHKGQDITLRHFKGNPAGKLYNRLGFVNVEEQPYHIKMLLKNK